MSFDGNHISGQVTFEFNGKTVVLNKLKMRDYKSLHNFVRNEPLERVMPTLGNYPKNIQQLLIQSAIEEGNAIASDPKLLAQALGSMDVQIFSLYLMGLDAMKWTRQEAENFYYNLLDQGRMAELETKINTLMGTTPTHPAGGPDENPLS